MSDTPRATFPFDSAAELFPARFLRGAHAALEARLALAFNHVLQGHPEAMDRLASLAGKSLRVRLDGLPAFPGGGQPVVTMQISPVGLFEPAPGVESADDPALAVRLLDLPRLGPWRWREAVDLQGSPEDIEQLRWLLEHVRWEPLADLERLGLPAPIVAFLSALRARPGHDGTHDAG